MAVNQHKGALVVQDKQVFAGKNITVSIPQNLPTIKTLHFDPRPSASTGFVITRGLSSLIVSSAKIISSRSVELSYPITAGIQLPVNATPIVTYVGNDNNIHIVDSSKHISVLPPVVSSVPTSTSLSSGTQPSTPVGSSRPPATPLFHTYATSSGPFSLPYSRVPVGRRVRRVARPDVLWSENNTSEKEDLIIYVVSDLHLSDKGPTEDFTDNANTAFGKLLDHIEQELETNGTVQLVINGDWLDLWAVVPSVPRHEEHTSLDYENRLTRILNSHKGFFPRLKSFLKKPGASLVYVLGNHDDILNYNDKIRPKRPIYDARGLLTKLALELGGSPGNLTILPEFYSVPAYNLRIEHGHIIDEYNSFPGRSAWDPYKHDIATYGQICVELFVNWVEMLPEYYQSRSYPNQLIETEINTTEYKNILRAIDNFPEYLDYAIGLEEKEQNYIKKMKRANIKKEEYERVKHIYEDVIDRFRFTNTTMREYIPNLFINKNFVDILKNNKEVVHFFGKGEKEKTSQRAKEVNVEYGMQIVVMGHTHLADFSPSSVNMPVNFCYANTHTWTKQFELNHQKTDVVELKNTWPTPAYPFVRISKKIRYYVPSSVAKLKHTTVKVGDNQISVDYMTIK